jgi:phosphohistidine phosphatase
MELILWRHAEAEDVGPSGDLSRRLTKKGRKQAERMAAWLDARLAGEWRIVASPAQRTLETVAALERDYEVSEEVSTAATARSVLAEAGWPDEERVLVVGHQPTLGEVAAKLLGAGGGDFSVRKGAVLWFVSRTREGRAETVLKAVIDPETLEDGAK